MTFTETGETREESDGEGVRRGEEGGGGGGKHESESSTLDMRSRPRCWVSTWKPGFDSHRDGKWSVERRPWRLWMRAGLPGKESRKRGGVAQDGTPRHSHSLGPHKDRLWTG